MATALFFGAPAQAQHHEEALHQPSPWLVHIESETEFALKRPEIGQIFTLEGGVRIHTRLYLTASALLHLGDTTNVGGGIGVRYESPDLEALGRVTFDHRMVDFPENAIRAEARVVWWAHHHLGVIARATSENFPSSLNVENPGRWEMVAAAGIVGRYDHHFVVGVLSTLRFPDIAAEHPVDATIDPGILILLEGALP